MDKDYKPLPLESLLVKWQYWIVPTVILILALIGFSSLLFCFIEFREKILFATYSISVLLIFSAFVLLYFLFLKQIIQAQNSIIDLRDKRLFEQYCKEKLTEKKENGKVANDETKKEDVKAAPLSFQKLVEFAKVKKSILIDNGKGNRQHVQTEEYIDKDLLQKLIEIKKTL